MSQPGSLASPLATLLSLVPTALSGRPACASAALPCHSPRISVSDRYGQRQRIPRTRSEGGEARDPDQIGQIYDKEDVGTYVAKTHLDMARYIIPILAMARTTGKGHDGARSMLRASSSTILSDHVLSEASNP